MVQAAQPQGSGPAKDSGISSPRRAKGEGAAAPRPRVVLVEDDRILCRVLTLFLHQDYRVLAFSTAAEAMTALTTNDVDVVISDIRMPAVDGFELRRWIEAQPAPERPRFIFLSSYDDSVTLRRAVEVGFDAYVVKPVSRDQLLDAVEGVLGRP